MGLRARWAFRMRAALVAVTLATTGLAVGSPAAGAAPGSVRGAVRVDQVGYAVGEHKQAFLLAEAPAGGPGSRSSTPAGARC